MKAVEKRLNARERWRRFCATLDHRTLSTDAFRSRLGELGIVDGATVMVHCSMNDLGRRLPELNVVQIIQMLEQALGAAGTLLMPTFSFSGRQLDYVRSGSVFDVDQTPSQTGLMSEVFRRMPGVLRSRHPTHSVAARGPLAERLLQDHHKGSTFGESSPFYRLQEVGGWVVGLGVDIRRGYTILHVSEELDPRARAHFFLNETVAMKVAAGDHEEVCEVRPLRPTFHDGPSLQKILVRKGIFRFYRDNGLILSATEASAFVAEHRRILQEEPALYY